MPEALTPLQSSGVGEEPGPATMYTSTSESRSATASRSRQRSLSFDDVIAPVGDEQKNQLDLQQQATTSSSNTAEDMAADTNQWTAEKEARLQFVQRKLHEANKRWSAEQEKWLGEVDHLRELKRKVKAREKRSMRREEREKKKLKRTEATKGVGLGKENEEKDESSIAVEKKETDKGEGKPSKSRIGFLRKLSIGGGNSHRSSKGEGRKEGARPSLGGVLRRLSHGEVEWPRRSDSYQ